MYLMHRYFHQVIFVLNVTFLLCLFLIIVDLHFSSTESAQSFAQALREGSVIVEIIKLVLMGPPGVGKTSFLHLLFNWPAPKYHNSTAIASRPIRAIERVVGEKDGSIWERMEGVELLRKVMEALPNFFDSSEVDKESTPSTPSSVDERRDVPTSFIEAQHTDQQDIASVELMTHTIAHGATNLDPNSIIDSNAPYFSDQILDVLAKSNTSKGLHASTWIHVLDSGGQPQFADVSRAFLRGNCLNVIVTKLNEFLSGKPKFLYSVDGQVVHQPSLLQMTNLQLIEYFVRSIASAKHTVAKGFDKIDSKHTVAKSFNKIDFKPLFCIVGTNYDNTHGITTLFKELEPLHEKNSQLLRVLHEFRDHFIFYNESEDELIFPVDNTCKWNRKQISEDIRSRITSYENVAAEVEIPIRWYVFELRLKEVAEKMDHGIVSLSRCIEIGQELKMKAFDTTHCVEYLNYLSLVLYFPDVNDNVIFTNPQYLVNLVTSIIRASFVDPVKCKIIKDCAPYPGWNQQLRHKGIFESKLLDALVNVQFVEGLFTKENFLELMAHLCIVSPLTETMSTSSTQQYFIPAVLPSSHITEEEKKRFKKTCQPMVLQFENKVVPQVSYVIHVSHNSTILLSYRVFSLLL